MRLSLFALLASLLCAPAFAAQADAPEAYVARADAAPFTGPAAQPLAARSSLAADPVLMAPYGQLQLDEPQLGAPDRGWGEEAGILAFSLAALSIAGGLLGQTIPSNEAKLWFAFGTAFTTGVMVPRVFSGGRTSRRAGHVDGLPVLRTAGWIAYGVGFFYLFGKVFVWEVARLPIITGSLGALAYACHGVDAWVAGRQAREVIDGGGRPAVAPYVAPTRLADGRTGASIGLTGSF